MFGSALYGAESQGPDIYLKMKKLAELKAQEQGQDMFLKYIMEQNQNSQPTANNPSPGQDGKTLAPPPEVSGPAGAAPSGGAPAPAGGGGGASAASPAPSTGFIPPALTDFIRAIKKDNPKASNDEVMAALAQAEPWMTAAQQQALAQFKQQWETYKFDRTAGQRDRQLDIAAKRAKDYHAWMVSRPNGKDVLDKSKAIDAKIQGYNKQLQAIKDKHVGMAPSPSDPDYQEYQWLSSQVQAGYFAKSQLFQNASLPPPPQDVQMYWDSQGTGTDDPDSSGGDTSGGK